MKKNFKTVLSVFCAVTLLASLIIPSLVLPAAAYTIPTEADSITYTFNGNDFKANATVANVKVSGAQFAVENGELKIAGHKVNYDGAARCVIFNNGSEILKLDPGTYAVNFKYRYEYTKHTNSLYCAKYNNYKSNPHRFHFVANIPEGTGVPSYANVTVLENIITTSEEGAGDTYEKTLTVTIGGTKAVNFGIIAAYQECDVHISELTVAKKTAIEIIPTDGVDTAQEILLSGIPGTAATLPDADSFDGVIAGKVFDGFYSDAALTTPVTAAQAFPTDALSKKLYAKMVVKNTYPEGAVIIDFETDTEGGNTGMVNIISTTDKNNLATKVLSVKGANQDRVELIKKSDGSTYSLTKGKWKLTFDYYIPDSVGQENVSIRYGVLQGNTQSQYMSGTELTGALITDKSTLQANKWYSAEKELTVGADITDIGFCGHYNDPIYIDNVVFTPVLEEPKEITMNFEEDTADYTGSKLLGIINTTGKNGEPSKVLSADSDNQIRTQLVKNKNGSVYTLKKGVWKVTYDYKVPTANAQKIRLFYNVTIDAHPTITPAFDYTSGRALSDENLVKVHNMGDTWLSDSILINIEEDVSHIGFAAECYGTASTAYPVYIDNVVFTSVTESVVTLSFDTLGGNEIDPVQGIIGETVTVADPVRDGYEFKGWYEDALCTVPSDMKFKEGITSLYAGWAEAGKGLEFDFDTKNKNFKTGGNFSGGIYTIQNDPVGESGNTLGINALSTKCNHGDNRAVRLNDGSKGINLDKGLYKIEYKYYAVYRENGYFGNQSASFVCNNGCNELYKFYENPSAIKLRFGATGDFVPTGVVSLASATDVLFDMSLVTAEYESRWLSGWSVLEITEEMVENGQNKLVLCADKLPFTVYLDDIKINAIDTTPVTISFDSKGGTDVESICVNSYTALTLPTTSRVGYVFGGWVDKNGNPAPAYAPTVDTTYYASWSEVGKYIYINADNGFLTGNAETYGSGYFTKNTAEFKNDPEHKNTIKYYSTNGSNQARIHLLSAENKFAHLSPGKLYKVTFDYYVDKLPVSDSFAVDFTINHNDTSGWLYNPYTAKRLTGGNIISGVTNKSTDLVGKWMTAEIALQVPTDITDSRLGLYVVNGKDTVVYFDNIKFESIEGNTVLLTYTVPATGQTAYIIGDRGTRIDTSKIPTVVSDKLEFAGWYSDEEFKNPFTASVFPSRSMTIYGKTQLTSKGVHINFADYPWRNDTSSHKISASVMSVQKGMSYDGDGYALKFDNTGESKTPDAKRLLLNLENGAFPLQNGVFYVFSYHYYLETERESGTMNIKFASNKSDSMWNGAANITESTSHYLANNSGKWHTGFAIGQVKAVSADATFLHMQIQLPTDSVVYFDDIVIYEIPSGKSAVIYSTTEGTAPAPEMVKTGSRIKLPKVTDLPSNKEFTGWFNNEYSVGIGDFTVSENVVLSAGIVTKKITEDFESFTSEFPIGGKRSGYDSDWEIYDSTAKGNSANNVKRGRYALHRIGDEPGIKGHSLFMNSTLTGNELVFGKIYTVSMWVKVKDPVHTLGAVELCLNETYRHAWVSSTGRMAICSIADIADGDWHKISFTFAAASRYISIFTPGNLEMFIDDVTVEYTPDAAVSEPALFEEYIAIPLTEDGKYINPENESALNEFELVKHTDVVTKGNSHIVEFITQNVGATIAIIVGAAVLIVGATVLVIILIKKRKTREGKN